MHQAEPDASPSRERAGKVTTAEEEAGAAVLLLAPLSHEGKRQVIIAVHHC